MQVSLTPEQEAFIRQAVASGRYRNAEDAVRHALARWEHGERSRAELLAALDEGEADYASGQVSRYTADTLSTLAADLKREARASRKPS